MGACLTNNHKKSQNPSKHNIKSMSVKGDHIENTQYKKEEFLQLGQKQYPQNPYILNGVKKEYAKLWHESYNEIKEKMQKASMILQDDQNDKIKQGQQNLQIKQKQQVKQENQAGHQILKKQQIQIAPHKGKIRRLKSLFEQAKNKQRAPFVTKKFSFDNKQPGLQSNDKKRKRLFNNKYIIKQILQNYNEQIGICSICTEMYNESDRLPMMICMNQHTFCQRCINDLWQKGYHKCPLDQSVYKINNIQKNRLVLQIVKEFNEKNMKRGFQ